MLKGLRVETNIIAQRGFMPELQKRVWLFCVFADRLVGLFITFQEVLK